MKKIFLIASLFLCTMAFGQSKDSTKHAPKDSTIQYAELVATPRMFSQKSNVYFLTAGNSYGGALPYDFPIDALNAYAKMGWRLASSYATSYNGVFTTYFIIERK